MLISTEEDQVAVFRIHTLKNRSAYGNRQILHDGRLQAFLKISLVIDFDISQTFGTVDAYKLGVVVDLFTGKLVVAARYFKCGNARVRIICRSGKHLEFNIFYQILDVDKLQRNTHIRLV